MILNKRVLITKIVQETPDSKTFYVENPKEPYMPGQFFMISITIDGKDVKRAYSIATSPTEEELAFTIKITPGGAFSTHACTNMNEGDEMIISGPYGKFVYNDEKEAINLIGAGSGIVPLRGILQYIVDKNYDLPVKLFFSNKTEQDIIYKEYFEKMKNETDIFTYYYTLTALPENSTWDGARGRITKEILENEMDNPDGINYICGSPDFVRAIEAALKEMGVPEEKIKTEKYN